MPLSLASTNTVEPTLTRGTNPKSTVLSPLLSSVVVGNPGSPSGSSVGVKLITVDWINPSVNPSPSVSSCKPLSSLSTPLSAPSVVLETGKLSGAIN